MQVAMIVAKSRTGFYFVQRCAQQKKDALQVAEVLCYTAQFFSNLQRNGVALQVAVVVVALQIAQCNRALRRSYLSYNRRRKEQLGYVEQAETKHAK